MNNTTPRRPRRSISQRAEAAREHSRSIVEEKRKFRNNFLYAFGIGIQYLYLSSNENRTNIRNLFQQLTKKDKDGKQKFREHDFERILRGIAYLDKEMDMENRIYLEGVTDEDKKYLESHGAEYDINEHSYFISRGKEADFVKWIPEHERIYLKISSDSEEAQALLAQGALVDAARKELYIFKSMESSFQHWIPKSWTLPAWKQIELETPKKERTLQRFKEKAENEDELISAIDGKFFAEPGFDLLLVKSFLPEELQDLLVRGRVYLETEMKVKGDGIKFSPKMEKFYIVKGNDISGVLEYFPPLIQELINERKESWDIIWGNSGTLDTMDVYIESLWDENGRIYLNVPFDPNASEHPEKDEVKSWGAIFDGDKKKWYIIKGKNDPIAFLKYLPKS